MVVLSVTVDMEPQAPDPGRLHHRWRAESYRLQALAGRFQTSNSRLQRQPRVPLNLSLLLLKKVQHLVCNEATAKRVGFPT